MKFCKYVLSMILIKLSVKHIIFCSNETCLKRFWSTSAAKLFSFKTIFSQNLCTSSKPRKHKINYMYIIKIHTKSFLECINCCKYCIKIFCLWIITDTPKDHTLGWRSFLQNWPCCSGLSGQRSLFVKVHFNTLEVQSCPSKYFRPLVENDNDYRAILY